MKKMLYLAAVLLCIVIVAACTKGADTAQSTTTDTLASYYAEGGKASWLAGMHAGVDVSCNGCHGDTMDIDDSETVLNAKCAECHGTQDDLAKVTPGDFNPHGSHIATAIECTTCHKGHETSFSYCNYCHTFEDTITFNGPKKPIIIENFDAYDNAKPVRVETTDVIVIGSGGTGMSAAITAKEAGVNVIMLEKMSMTGGNTMMGSGSMNAADTKVQAAQGIEDSVELYMEDTLKGGGRINDPALVRVLAEESSTSIDWLVEHGVVLDYFIGIGGGASVVRGHGAPGGKPVGAFILKGLKPLIKEKGIDLRTNSQVVKILTDASGAATGVLVKGKHTGLYQINAKAIVVASGGFGANNAMVMIYRPDALGMSTSNQPGATGDSIELGVRAGAALTDVEQVQIHPSIAFGTQILISEKTRGVGAVLINVEGNRFYNELLTRDKVSAAILAQPGAKAWLVYDQAMRDNMAMIDGYAKLGLVVEDTTIEGLAAKMGVNVGNMTKTVAAYNEAIKTQKDAFGRTDLKAPITTPNYGAILISPGVHYTMGGLKINTEAQVIGTNGQPIPNLFAGGEATGGVHGANRLGGNSISETMTFGRLAGTNAAALVKSK